MQARQTSEGMERIDSCPFGCTVHQKHRLGIVGLDGLLQIAVTLPV